MGQKVLGLKMGLKTFWVFLNYVFLTLGSPPNNSNRGKFFLVMSQAPIISPLKISAFTWNICLFRGFDFPSLQKTFFWTFEAFSRLAYKPFADSVKNSTNPKTAETQFLVFANQISLLGRKAIGQRARLPSCDLKRAGRIPCELLDMPENGEICDLMGRIRNLFQHVSKSCNKEWKVYFGDVIEHIESG